MTTVSVIVPLWNGEKWIRACLSALAGQRQPAPFAVEVVVVDNNSADDSPSIVQREFPWARLLRNGRNLGFAGGCNVGLAAARGDVLVLLNQDTIVQPGWLAGLVAALGEGGAGVAGSLALLADGQTVQHAGGELAWPLGVARHRGYGERLAPAWQQPGPVPFVTGASLALRRDVLNAIGPLDEGFWPGYYEDVDFCRRAREAGYSVHYAPDSVLIHAEADAFGVGVYGRWAQLRGRLRFCLKHLTAAGFVEEFLPAEAAYGPTLLAGTQPGEIARAYLEAMPMLYALWRERGESDERIGQGLAGLAQLCPPPLPAPPHPADVPPAPTPFLAPSPLDRLPLGGRARRALHQLVIFYSERRQRELLAHIRRLEAEIARLQAKAAD